MDASQNQQVNIHELLERFKSKKEFYRFLQLDCKAYLPKIGSVNIYFFKQILQSQKEVQISLQYMDFYIKVSSTPHIEGLTVQDFLNYARQRENILKFLPEERDWVHLDRQWISDILYSIDTENFEIFIKEAISRRQQKYEEQQNMNILMRPEFVQALRQCQSFSHEKDSSKRKRKRTEIEEVKIEEENLKNNKQEYLKEHKRLKTQNQELELQIELLNNNQGIINQLIENGIINESGNFVVQQQFNI